MTTNDRNRMTLDRRHALALGGAALTLPFFGPGAARAAAEITFCNWGGDAITHMGAAFAEPFGAESGIKVNFDGAGPTEGKIKAMVESGSVTWNVVDSDGFSAVGLGKAGLLEPIDYTIVDKAKVLPDFVYEHGVGGYIYSYCIAYDSAKVGEPKTFADLWDLEKFPGKRTFWKWMVGALEAALMADGVAPADVYKTLATPEGLDKAFAKFEPIKDQIILWDAGSQSQQLLREGEVSCGQIWHTRANQLAKDTEGRIKWHFNQAPVAPGTWCVPKGAPNLKETMQFIASMQDPARQVKLLASMGNGPVNPAAAALVPAEFKAVNPGDPDNYKIQLPLDAAWYATNYGDVLNRWLDFFA